MLSLFEGKNINTLKFEGKNQNLKMFRDCDFLAFF